MCMSEPPAVLTLFLTFGGFATTTGGSGLGGLARITFADTRSFPAQVSQVVELGATNVTLLHDVNVINYRRMQREDSFHSHTKTCFANSDRFAHAPVFTRDA